MTYLTTPKTYGYTTLQNKSSKIVSTKHSMGRGLSKMDIFVIYVDGTTRVATWRI